MGAGPTPCSSHRSQRARCERPSHWPADPLRVLERVRPQRPAGGRGTPRSAFHRGNGEGVRSWAAPGACLLSLGRCFWSCGSAEAGGRAVRPRLLAHRRARAAAPRPCTGRRRPRTPQPIGEQRTELTRRRVVKASIQVGLSKSCTQLAAPAGACFGQSETRQLISSKSVVSPFAVAVAAHYADRR